MMAKYLAVLYLLAGLIAVKALEDPDLIKNCGDAKALALGLAPSASHTNSIGQTALRAQTPGIIYAAPRPYGYAVKEARDKSRTSSPSITATAAFAAPAIAASYPIFGDHTSDAYSSYSSNEHSAYSGDAYSFLTAAPVATKYEVAPVAVKTAAIPAIPTYASRAGHIGTSYLSAGHVGPSLIYTGPSVSKIALSEHQSNAQQHYHDASYLTATAPAIKISSAPYATANYLSNDLGYGGSYAAVSGPAIKLTTTPIITSNHLTAASNHGSYSSDESYATTNLNHLSGGGALHSAQTVAVAPTIKLASAPLISSNHLTTSSDHGSYSSGGSYASLAVNAPSIATTSLNHLYGGGTLHPVQTVAVAPTIKLASAPLISSNHLTASSDHGSYSSGGSYASLAVNAPSIATTSLNHLYGGGTLHPVQTVAVAPTIKLAAAPLIASNHLTASSDHGSYFSGGSYGSSYGAINAPSIATISLNHLSGGASALHSTQAVAPAVKLTAAPLITSNHLSSDSQQSSYSSASSHSSGASYGAAIHPLAVGHAASAIVAAPAAPVFATHASPVVAAPKAISTSSSSLHGGYVSSGPVIKASTAAVVKPIAVKQDGYYDAHPRYAFEYGVHDTHTGDIKEQKEHRQGDVVQGHYALVEPDGNVRTVQYTADWETGFHAKVTNSKHSTHAH